MEKNLNYLNTKWWYRLLKICYVLFFLLITVSSIALIVSSYPSKVDTKESHLACDNGERVSFDTFSQKEGSTMTSANFNSLCFQAHNPSDFNPYAYGAIPVGGKEEIFKFVYVYSPRNWTAIIGFSLISIIIASLAFEFIKRLFYYIIFGSFFPEKPKKFLFFKVSKE